MGNKEKASLHSIRQSPAKYWHSLAQLKFRRDYRSDLPPSLLRFTGYRPPDAGPPYDPLPIPPFIWLHKIPLKYETWLFAWIGAFGGILLIEAIMSTDTAFRDVYHTPTIITSFGASAVLLFGVVESPVAQPRNFVGGHFLSALVGTCITRLFVLNGQYQGYLDNTHFHPSTFINGGISMATSLLVMLITGTVHPPAGATGLNAAVQSDVVSLSWRYLPTILASSLIMLAWAILVNNLGRRRYPLHWWAPGPTFVLPPDQNHNEELCRVEEGEIERNTQERDPAVEIDNSSEDRQKRVDSTMTGSSGGAGAANTESHTN
ncbi:HPP family-domain-containing protein [Aspergillus pseudocaelatus]|uniref:HPP family-domain-containing protein n=1 Tax=Aspergillus pseudocaelatus TaxID=1825620 RepID=A0ABQ6WYZ0_9EURO|nr:HPP family-domain-containing protein [Aspergillus pseudocaelatus]